MVFSSLVFVFIFLPLVLFIHTWLFCHLQKKYSHTIVLNAFLFICSLLFYAWGEPQHLLVLLICTLATFHIGIALQKKKTTLLLYVGISVNLAILLYYKYGMLIIGDSLQAINVLLPNTLESSEVNISLPLGVSFYVFQAASYLIDVYRKEVAPSRNIINFGCYLTMFPQLVAGPIVRYSQIADELITRHISLDNCAYGISRFIIGLAKKILIADTLGFKYILILADTQIWPLG
jgi:alginate O-acetyltransferase complex protein AlgI